MIKWKFKNFLNDDVYAAGAHKTYSSYLYDWIKVDYL